jgi:hypothetical protein
VRLGSEASEQPRSPAFLRDSLLWIGSRDCSHKNGIFYWLVVFVSFNIKRKKEFQVKLKFHSKKTPSMASLTTITLHGVKQFK